MSTALKDRYNVEFYNTLYLALKQAKVPVDLNQFHKDIFTPAFKEAELKGRMSLTAAVLKGYLSENFPKASEQIIQTIGALKTMGVGENFEYMFLPEYIATNGMDDFKTSMIALALITPFTSAEFAVRPFIIRYPKRMTEQLLNWSIDKNPKVRRLASEGSRPRLPWAMALPQYINDPTPVIPILENLKTDSDYWVRRSVSNHLNDISKDNPNLAKEIAFRWHGKNEMTDTVVKHACRTLLKTADAEILALFGLDSKGLNLGHFTLMNDVVNMGERLSFDLAFY